MLRTIAADAVLGPFPIAVLIPIAIILWVLVVTVVLVSLRRRKIRQMRVRRLLAQHARRETFIFMSDGQDEAFLKDLKKQGKVSEPFSNAAQIRNPDGPSTSR